MEGVAKLRISQFLSDFVEIWPLMQIHIPLKVGDLHQRPKIGKSGKKRPAGVLQLPQPI